MITKFYQTFILERLSFEFKAYLPSSSLAVPSPYAPAQHPPIVVREGLSRAVAFAHWGYFAKGFEISFDRSKAWPFYPFARIEQISNSRLYARSLQKRMLCLIPVTAFVHGAKNPAHVSLADGDIFSFGGVWTETSAGPDRDEKSFVILTTPSSRALTSGPRMPLCLERQFYQPWLEGGLNMHRALKINESLRLRIRAE